MRLYLIRHGETVIGPDRLYPRGAGLTRRGAAQARSIAGALCGLDIDLIVTSSLRRAYETARPLVRATGVRPLVMPSLNEIYVGSLWDAPAEAIQEVFDSGWRPDFVRFGGEDASQFEARITGAFQHLVQTARKHDATSVAVFTHGGTINTVIDHIHGRPFTRDFSAAPNGSISLVQVEDGRPEVAYAFDVGHLAGG